MQIINIYKWLLCTSVVSFMLGFIVNKLLISYKIIDRPNERSSHSKPTVRGGGIGIIAIVFLSAGYTAISTRNFLFISILLAAAILAFCSFLDDVIKTTVKLRLYCHGFTAVTATYIFYKLYFLKDLDRHIPYVLLLVLGILCFLWISGHTNAFNFMDGINGLASMQAIITSIGTVLIIVVNNYEVDPVPIVVLLSIGGACIGFLPHNFPRARMFMGDVGSATVGYLLAVTVVWLALKIDIKLLLPFILLHANFVLDTGITFVRRIISGASWAVAHKEHFYQRLVHAGKSHTKVTLTETALQIIVLLLLLRFPDYTIERQLFVTLTIILIWLSFFYYANRNYKLFMMRQNN